MDKNCPLKDDWKNWPTDMQMDRLFMICPHCKEFGSHVRLQYCKICGNIKDFSWHNLTAEQCSEYMKSYEGRTCANPSEHHAFVARPK